MQSSPEEVIEGHNSNITEGLSIGAISSLTRIHGLNKLEGEAKVHNLHNILHTETGTISILEWTIEL